MQGLVFTTSVHTVSRCGIVDDCSALAIRSRTHLTRPCAFAAPITQPAGLSQSRNKLRKQRIAYSANDALTTAAETAPHATVEQSPTDGQPVTAASEDHDAAASPAASDISIDGAATSSSISNTSAAADGSQPTDEVSSPAAEFARASPSTMQWKPAGADGSRLIKRPQRPIVSGTREQIPVSSPDKPPQLVKAEDIWFSEHDTVSARVVWANGRGARVSLTRSPEIIGYMPEKEGPRSCIYEQHLSRQPENGPCMMAGITREFTVLKVPANMAYNGIGPLLSARQIDSLCIWRRAEQALKLSQEDKETFLVHFSNVNEGGLIGQFMGLKIFMPLSHIHRSEPDMYLSHEEIFEKYCKGKATCVAITEADMRMKRFLCSESGAVTANDLRKLTEGTLIWGTIRRMQPFGAFVGIDNTNVSGLLHISNISRQHFEYIEDVLKIGDRIRCLVISISDKYSRISLSTSDLEVNSGDMITNQEAVFENADKVLAEIEAEAAEWRRQHPDEV